MTDSNRLNEGDKAPDFSLTSDSGETVSLGDFAGRRVVVYFYPRANTPGCTKEACDFRDSLEQLNGQDIDVVGISPDKPEKLAKFREDHELNFPLLSDPDKEVMTAYGAFGEKKNYGKVTQGGYPVHLPRGAGRHHRPDQVQRQGHRPRRAHPARHGRRRLILTGHRK